MEMNLKLNDKAKIHKKAVAIVTGGSSGIGRALCEEIACRGHVAIVTDINKKSADAVATEISNNGGEANSFFMDVTKIEDVRNVIKQVLSKYGHIEYYFNNAGVACAGEIRDMTYDYWKKILNVNLWGIIHGIQEIYPLMIKQGSGHIVNIASLAGIVVNVNSPAYTTSKFAIVGLSKALLIEAEHFGVQVSLVCPGSIKTGIGDHTEFLRTDKDAFLKYINKMRKNKWYSKEWDVEKAAKYIMNKTEEGKFLILLPRSAKFVRFLNRIFPNFVLRVQRKLLKNFRDYRIN
ncbi:MAG: SDR family NAD(P)-dependent oxidoreductase [Candidatus Lokiarchaeota archaeon]|nr:SDR family NAD(P)-dependent oxidoreductase [Candidatus Lokiarchaeota archaeon]